MRDSPAHEEQLAVLFRAHYDEVWRYLRRRSTREVADDIAAQTFATAWRRIEEVPPAALPWLLVTARLLLRNERRAQARGQALNARVRSQPSPPVSDVEDVVRVSVDLSAALARLPERDRELLMLIAWEELSAAEAAIVLGCNRTALATRLLRARRRLRALLDEHCAAPPQLSITRSEGVPR